MRHSKLFSILLLNTVVCLTNASGQTRPIRTNDKYARRVDFSLYYDFRMLGQTSEIKLRVNLPKTIPEKQKILSIDFSPKPTRIFSKNGNKYADFVFYKSQKRFRVKIDIKADLFRYNLVTARMRPEQKLQRPPNLNEYLKHERMVEKNHPLIQQIASTITGQSETEIIQNIYEYVIDNMTYDTSSKKGNGAAIAAHNKKGKCIDYSDLFVALCRATHIPARVVTGFTTELRNNQGHSWVEFYLQKYGWIPIDPTYGINASSSSRKYVFYNPGANYIYFTHIRNDEALKNYHFYFCEYKGKKVKVKYSIEFRQPFIYLQKGLQNLPEHIQKKIAEIKSRRANSNSHSP